MATPGQATADQPKNKCRINPTMPGGPCVDGPDRGPIFLETGPSPTREATLYRNMG